MNSSPITPTGTGCMLRSSTYIWVLAIGRPMGISPSDDVTWWRLDHTVVSVGPYMFQTEPALRINCCANSRDIASPPLTIFKLAFPGHPDSSNSFQVDGVACIAVISQSSSILHKRCPSPDDSRLASTQRAPTIKGR